MSWLFIVSNNDTETVFNVARLANFALKQGKAVNMFMLGKGVEYAGLGNEHFDVQGQLAEFDSNGGTFLV